MPLLEKIITEFRDDELEHLDTAVEHDAQQAPGHALLSAVIGFGCKRAISIARRIWVAIPFVSRVGSLPVATNCNNKHNICDASMSDEHEEIIKRGIMIEVLM
jgi:hypothetical protein